MSNVSGNLIFCRCTQKGIKLIGEKRNKWAKEKQQQQLHLKNILYIEIGNWFESRLKFYYVSGWTEMRHKNKNNFFFIKLVLFFSVFAYPVKSKFDTYFDWFCVFLLFFFVPFILFRTFLLKMWFNIRLINIYI